MTASLGNREYENMDGWQIVCGSHTELTVLWQSIKMEHATRCDVGESF